MKPEWLRQSFLICKAWHRVIKDFQDIDGDWHPIGEEWQFLGCMVNNYDGEVTFAERRSNDDEWQFILGDDKDRQHEVLTRITEYLEQI